MYSKLAFRNVKKSFGDYAIYFLTLMFGVCIFYVFNSIDAQHSMMLLNNSQVSGVEMLQLIMGYISIFISVILGFLIVYANRFLVRRRKKELGIYQVLGMEKGQIGRILLIETLLVAILSLAVGLILGILISQGFAVLTASLFDIKLTAGFKFIFSSSATLKAILYFGIAFLLVIIFNRITIGKQKLIDLLHAERTNEKYKTPHLILSVFLFIFSAISLGIAYYIVEQNGAYISKMELLTATILGIVGTFLFFFSLSGFFLKVIQKNKKLYFKDLNIFVLRQINSKITTAFVSISMVCLMLFLSICALSFGMGFSKSLTADLEELNPFDVIYTVYMHTDPSFSDTGEFIGYDNASENTNLLEELERVSTPINSYAKSVTEVSFRAVPEPVHDYGQIMRGEYLSLSDFNELLEMQGKAPMTLADNEFILNCLDTQHHSNYTAYFEKNTVNILDTDLTLKTTDDTILYNTPAADLYICIHVLPDKLLENTADYAKFLAIDYIDQTHKYRDLREQATDEMFENLLADENSTVSGGFANDRIDTFEDSKSTAVTFAYLAVYLGVVFAIVSAVVLAITQLSEASDNAHRYGLLRKLGADYQMINKALLRQITIYFGVPLLLALVHSIWGLRFANDMITNVGKSNILRDSAITVGVLVIIYGGYFLATYLGSRRIIESNK